MKDYKKTHWVDHDKITAEKQAELDKKNHIAEAKKMVEIAERCDAEEFLLKKNISNHPRIQDSVKGESDYEVADLMAEFANEYYNRDER